MIAGIAGWIAARFVRGGAPPTPQLAIDEAMAIKETVTSSHPRRRFRRCRRSPQGRRGNGRRAQRSSAEIRRSIEANRAELAHSLEKLRGEVAEITDWRKQLGRHQREAMIGAAVAGFVIGGGIAAIGGLFGRRRRR